MKRILFILISFFVFLNGFSQDNYIDSLEKELLIVENEKEIININQMLSDHYAYYGSLDSSIAYTKKNILLTKNVKDWKNHIRALDDLSSSFLWKGNIDSSIFYYQKAILKIKDYIPNDSNRLLSCFSGLGYSYNAAGSFDSAIFYFQKAIKNVNKETPLYLESSIFVGLSDCYSVQNDTLNYQKYINKAIEIIDTMPTEKLAVLWRLTSLEKDHHKSLKILNKGYEMSLLYDSGFISVYSYKIGSRYLKLKELDSAELYYNRALESYIKRKKNRGIISTYLGLGTVLSFKDLNLSEKYYFKALELAKKIKNKRLIKNCYKSISKSFKRKKNYKSAYDYYDLYKILSDSLFNEEKHKQVAELEIKYETEIKETEIKELALKNKLSEAQANTQKTKASLYLFGGVGSLLFLSLSGFFFYRQRKNRFEKEQYKLEQKLLRTQLNPHFMSNFLMAIQTSVHKDTPEIASKNVSKFGRLNRQVLEASRNDYILLEDEIDFLKNYMDLHLVLSPNKFKYSIEVAEDIDDSEISLPPMLIQPFIENAIEHAFINTEEKGEIKIRFNIEKNNLLINITDNGVGRKASEISTSDFKHTSHATKITQERIALFKRKWNKNIMFNINDLQQGTVVLFQIPLNA